MVAIYQGIDKTTVFKKQTALGTPAAGSGGQIMRREKSTFTLAKATFENNEIATHQQSTGVTGGGKSVTGSLDGVVSPSTYSDLIASLLRAPFATTTPITGLSLTITSPTSPHTITANAATPFLTGGIKIGDVIRLSVGALNAANINKNLIVTGVTASTLTVIPVNGVVMAEEGPIITCTVTVKGKKCIAPLTGHTREYWTVEDWYYASGGSRSELFTDVMIGSIDIGLPSTGNVTFASSYAGLDRTISASQVLTTPTAETTTPVLTAVNGVILIDNASYGTITAASIKIDGQAGPLGSVVGSDVSPDIQRGRIKVSGQFTAFFTGGYFSTLFENSTNIGLVIAAMDDSTATSDFVVFSMSSVVLTTDTTDDGEKGIIKTFQFVAEMNASGGAALANDKTIISIQDSTL